MASQLCVQQLCTKFLNCRKPYRTSMCFLQMEIYSGSQWTNSYLKNKHYSLTAQKTVTEKFKGQGRTQIDSFHCNNSSVLFTAQTVYPIKSNYWNQGIINTLTFICKLMLESWIQPIQTYIPLLNIISLWNSSAGYSNEAMLTINFFISLHHSY